jgi:hypothetical protein
MDHDDDVEHLFSWLQTPELRYREFAGAREITDTVVTYQARTNTEEAVEAETPTPGNTQLDEEYPADQFPDQVAEKVEFEPAPPMQRPPFPGAPAMIAPTPMPGEPPPAAVPPAANPGSPFALGATGRAPPPSREQPAEWAGPRPPLIQTPAARQAPPAPAVAPPTATPPPAPAARVAPLAPAAPVVPPAQPGGGLLGGAYRDETANGHAEQPAAAPAPEPQQLQQQQNERSLDAVFGRLSGRNRLPDPRDRLRHIPGLGPPAGRPR